MFDKPEYGRCTFRSKMSKCIPSSNTKIGNDRDFFLNFTCSEKKMIKLIFNIKHNLVSLYDINYIHQHPEMVIWKKTNAICLNILHTHMLQLFYWTNQKNSLIYHLLKTLKIHFYLHLLEWFKLKTPERNNTYLFLSFNIGMLGIISFRGLYIYQCQIN